MSEVNVPLLRKAVEWAEVEATKPFEECMWYQGSWQLPEGALAWNDQTHDREVKCGTAYCIAGWITAMTLAPDEYMDSGGDVWNSKTKEHVADCENRALAELGLDSDYVRSIDECLFDGDNSIERVREIAEALAGEKL